MITLCGFALSNYYLKVKLALLEKGIPFDEERVMTGAVTENVLAASPLAKIPFIRTEQGTLCESQVILDYLEAKVRELVTFIDLHLELVARDLYAEAFFGGKVSDEVKARTKKRLVRNVEGFKRLAKFSPYVAGETFTMADCAAWPSLPLVGMASRIIYGEDLLAAGGVDWKPYAKMIEQRPHAARLAAERKAEQAALAPKG
jgi:glutathione S-transferase